jgi:PAS domain S-box-containing protein
LSRGGLTGIQFAGKGVGFTSKGLLALLDQLPAALAVTRGPDHRFIYANQLYRSIHEPARGRLIGRPFATVFGTVLGESYLAKRDEVLRKGKVHITRDVLVAYDGRKTYWDITLVPILNRRKKPDGIMSIAVEVTERVLAREFATQFTRELQKQTREIWQERERLTIAVEATGIGIWEWEVESNQIFWSPRVKEIYGLPQEKEPDLELWQSSLHPDEREAVLRQVQSLLDPKSGGRLEISHRIVLADNTVKWVEASGRMLYAETEKGKKPTRLLGTVLDVTERQQGQEQLREALAIKDLLLRETHHRVKNSLQIVSAMLSLQERMARLPEVKAGLTDAAMRIRTVASLHEQLHRAQSTTAVELSAYLESLCKDLESTVGGPELMVEFSGERLWIANERAISIALIVNELATNALKYAYPMGSGVVGVRFSRVEGELLQLVVEDKGVGIGEDFEKKQNESLGLMMAQTMARQLGGEIVNEPVERGTYLRFVVPVREGS